MKKPSKRIFHLSENKEIGCTAEFFIDKRPEATRRHFQQCAASDPQPGEPDLMFVSRRSPAASEHLHRIAGVHFCSVRRTSSTGHAQ